MDARGGPEAGRSRGVLLDVLTRFWQEFFTALTIGGNEKIPYIRHDLQKAEWQAIERALVYGYQKMKYFPLQVSHLFVASSLFGEESITPDFLLKSFREYIAEEDREVLDMCLRDDFDLQDDDGNDNDDVLKFLSPFKCFRIPNKDSIISIISELAHQELIQKPRYVLNCWAPILDVPRCDHSFQTLEGLDQLYKSKRPIAKKTVKLLQGEQATDAERQSLDYLKKFVKSLEGKALSMFLRFCTGRDVITCDSIRICFSSLEGLQRRPVARTCVPIRELPLVLRATIDQFLYYPFFLRSLNDTLQHLTANTCTAMICYTTSSQLFVLITPRKRH
ncbi:uncharacterized protein LOC111338653 [Stylophora pistillata]|uniref:uncharacterized protein LOC111338653 n=1 Tax=Stylophora pistillata TaxID=50429 RepID=UPI000C03F712|nr:uncharacterized protein LOC111338653 [Stylophora pistillata]